MDNPCTNPLPAKEGYAVVYGQNLRDAAGNLITGAKLLFWPRLASGAAVAPLLPNDLGHVSQDAVEVEIDSTGKWQTYLARVDQTGTVPIWFRYGVVCQDRLGRSILGAGYDCFQPKAEQVDYDLWPPDFEGQVESVPGAPGRSAYQLYVDGGGNLAQADWLLSLHGAAGLSAYQTYQANGGTLSQTAWLASLKGKDGAPGLGGGESDAGRAEYEAANGITTTVGQLLTPTGHVAPTWVVGPQMTRSGPVSGIGATVTNLQAGDKLRISLCNRNADVDGQPSFTPVSTFDVALPLELIGVTAVTNVALVAGTHFAPQLALAGQYALVRFVTSASNQFLLQSAMPGADEIYLNSGADLAAGPNLFTIYSPASGFIVNLTLSVGATFVQPAAVTQAIKTAVQKVGVNTTPLYSTKFAGTVADPDWTQYSGAGTQPAVVTGAWSWHDGYVQSPGTGNGQGTYLSLNRYQSLQRRSVQMVFALDAAASRLQLNSMLRYPQAYQNDAYTVTGEGALSAFQVDAAAGTLNIMTGWGMGTTPTVAVSAPVTGGVVPNRKYLLDVTVDNRMVTLTLTDMVACTRTVCSLGDNSSDNGMYAAGKWGQFSDYLAISELAGSFKIYGFDIVANSANSHLVVAGDSITYGYGTLLSQTYPSKLAAMARRAGSVVTAGRSGGVTAGLVAAIDSEIIPLAPACVVVLIGTNDLGGYYNPTQANYPHNMGLIVSKLAAANIKLYVVRLLPRAGAYQPDFQAFEAVIDGLGVSVIPANVPLSTSFDGYTCNTSLFVDGLHPNDAGTDRIAACINAFAPDVLR